MRDDHGGPTCDEILLAISLQRHPTHGGGGGRVDGINVPVGTLEHLWGIRQEGMSDPCWYQQHREKSGFIPPDLHLLDAELDLFNGVPVDVVADLHLLPLHQLRPDNCKGTTRKTQMFTPLAVEVVLVEAGYGLICIRSGRLLRLGLEERAHARYCKRFIRGRNASCFLLGRKPVSKSLKKEELEFSSRTPRPLCQPVRGFHAVLTSEVTAPRKGERGAK